MKKINYAEGDCFSVPLREGGFGKGVVVRMDHRGGIFGCFFGPKVGSVEELEYNIIDPSTQVLMGQFGDLGLLNGEWKVIGKVSSWSRDLWAFPPSIKYDVGDDLARICTYDENTLEEISRKNVLISEIEASDYSRDGLMGYGFAEIMLTRLLSNPIK